MKYKFLRHVVCMDKNKPDRKIMMGHRSERRNKGRLKLSGVNGVEDGPRNWMIDSVATCRRGCEGLRRAVAPNKKRERSGNIIL